MVHYNYFKTEHLYMGSGTQNMKIQDNIQMKRTTTLPSTYSPFSQTRREKCKENVESRIEQDRKLTRTLNSLFWN